MTGAGWLIMWSRIKYSIISLLLLILFPCVATAALTDTATITIEATFTAPQCTLNVPKSVNLGNIKLGTITYNSFIIKVDCPGGAQRGVIYAQAAKLVSGSSDVAQMTGDVNGQLMLLEKSGTKISLTGIAGTPFCDGTATRECELFPRTWFNNKPTNGGSTSVIINFTLTQP